MLGIEPRSAGRAASDVKKLSHLSSTLCLFLGKTVLMIVLPVFKMSCFSKWDAVVEGSGVSGTELEFRHHLWLSAVAWFSLEIGAHYLRMALNQESSASTS